MGFYDPYSTAKSIATAMQRDKAQITRALNELLAEDLIVKQKNPQDGRSQLLKLTAKGDEVIAKLDAIEIWAKKRLTKNIASNELEQFIQVSRRMIDNATSHPFD